jgi:beta-aspartyl-peptidase (threonine type)
VHGGAGDVPEDRVPRHVDGCRAAARAGASVLGAGGSALDAAIAAVVVLEDDPVFNAGTGACLTRDGTIEMDAAVMDGGALRFGGVCAMPPFRNPIRIARAVLDDGEHILLAGEGAARFARERGFAPATLEELRTEMAVARLREVLARRAEPGWAGGTVGAVAVDSAGHLAAATSTGGMVGKRAGRVGDTPLIGCGTWADDRTVAASATGHGENISRAILARTAADLVGAGKPPQEAAQHALEQMLDRTGARAGVILVDPTGRVGIHTTTRTMTWALASTSGEQRAADR